MSSPEQAPQTHESLKPSEVAAERAEELLEKKIEAGAELGIESAERSEAKARHEALEAAISVEAGGVEKGRKGPKEGPAPAKRRGAISKKEKEASFKRHIKQVQEELPASQRAFSKVIHNKTVEKASEAIGATVARPNAILSGAVAAFVLVLAVYLIAKNLGYVLSGFETIGAFIVGWVLGILYDYFRVMITGKKS